jgi:hypothetical protein
MSKNSGQKGKATMARKVPELRARMSPESRARSEAKPRECLGDLKKEESPFAKYRGIGTSGIPSGRRGIAKWLKELRGR